MRLCDYRGWAIRIEVMSVSSVLLYGFFAWRLVVLTFSLNFTMCWLNFAYVPSLLPYLWPAILGSAASSPDVEACLLLLVAMVLLAMPWMSVVVVFWMRTSRYCLPNFIAVFRSQTSTCTSVLLDTSVKNKKNFQTVLLSPKYLEDSDTCNFTSNSRTSFLHCIMPRSLSTGKSDTFYRALKEHWIFMKFSWVFKS